MPKFVIPTLTDTLSTCFAPLTLLLLPSVEWDEHFTCCTRICGSGIVRNRFWRLISAYLHAKIASHVVEHEWPRSGLQGGSVSFLEKVSPHGFCGTVVGNSQYLPHLEARHTSSFKMIFPWFFFGEHPSLERKAVILFLVFAKYLSLTLMELQYGYLFR